MQLEIGKIYEGKVTGITKFGAFVDLGEGKTGMVHISEVAPTYVKEITDYLAQGQTVRVKVLNVAEDGKISLSVKQAADPQPQQQRPSHPRQNDGDRRPSFQQSRGQGQRGGQRSQGQHGQSQRGRSQYGQDFSYLSQPQEASGSKEFEDMLSRFMQRSDEKMSDLKKTMDTGSRRGSYQRRTK